MKTKVIMKIIKFKHGAQVRYYMLYAIELFMRHF